MKSNETWKIRRQALGISREKLAVLIGYNVQYVIDFENGEFIPRDVYLKIKDTLREQVNSLSEVEHYRTKILQTALEIKYETNTEMALASISHMMMELGKLQVELIGRRPNRKEDWEK